MAMLRQLLFCCYRDPDLFAAKNRARRSAPTKAAAAASASIEEKTKDPDPPLENGNQRPDLVTSHEQPHHSSNLSKEPSNEAVPCVQVQVTHSEPPQGEIVKRQVIRHAPVDEEPVVREKRELKSPTLQTVSISLAPTVMKPLAVDTTPEPHQATNDPVFLNTDEQQVRSRIPRRSGRSLFVIRHKSKTDDEIEKDQNTAEKSDDVDKVLLVQTSTELASNLWPSEFYRPRSKLEDEQKNRASSLSSNSETFETSDDLTYCITPSDR